MVTAGIFPFKEISHGRAGNRTRDLMIISQRLWPLDHEAGLIFLNNYRYSSLMKIIDKTSTKRRDIRLRMMAYARKFEDFVLFGLN